MKKLPKLWRRKKGGKEIGAFYVTVRDQPVNLGTQDATLAIKRRGEAVKGKRRFDEDADAAADGIAALAGGAPVAPPPPEPLALAPVPESAPPPAADAPPPAPDGVMPAPPLPEGWADTVGAAADAAAGEGAAGAPGPDGVPGAGPPRFTVTMDDIAKILGLPAEQLAPAVVELQVKAGEWFGRLVGYQIQPTPPEDMGRMLLAVGYVPVIRLLQVNDLNINPGWFILAGSAMIASAQMAGAKKIPKKTPAEAAAEKAAE